MLKPCANSSVAPLPQAGLRLPRTAPSGRGRAPARRPGRRPRAASAISATSRPSRCAFFQLGAALAHADDDVEAAVLQVQRMRAPLAAIAQDGDARALERLLVDVLLRIQTHRFLPLQMKNPASAWAGAGFLVSSLAWACQPCTSVPHLELLRRSRRRSATSNTVFTGMKPRECREARDVTIRRSGLSTSFWARMRAAGHRMIR